MNFKTRTLIAASLALAALGAQAHDMWFKPSSTVLSKSDWVTVDAAVSNDVFFFNHRPLSLEGVTVSAPDGSVVEMKNVAQGALRSVFDFKPEQTGTYRVTLLSTGVMGVYQDAKGQPQRARGSIAQVLQQIPADAQKVKIIENQRRMETFVSLGKPSAIAVSGKGLELRPVTHPNDLVANEEAVFDVLLDGQPAAHQEVELVADGIRYRDGTDARSFKADAQGRVTIRFPRAGLFWISTTAQDDKTAIAQATERRLSYIATLEVLP